MTSSSHSIQPALTSARSRRIVSGPASVGSKSERAHTSVADLTRQERRELDETFALALQGRRTKPRQSSSSSTEAPSAAELSVLLSDLRQESRSKRRVRSDGRHALERLASASSRQGIEQKSSDLAASVSASFAEFGSDGPGPSSTSDRRARRSSVSSVELSEVLSQILPKTHQQEAKLDGPEVLGTSPRKDHRRPPAPTRGRRSAPRSQKRDASPIPAVGRLRRDSSPSPNIVSQAPSAEPGRRRSSRSPAPPSIASAAAIVEQASMSQAGSCQVSSRRTSLDLDQISLGNKWKLPTQVQKGPATVEDTVADTRKLNELTAVPMSRSSSKQSAPASKGRYSRPSSVGGQSMISRPVESTQVARNLRRMMALTSSSDESDTTSVSSSLNNWRPSPRSLGPILGLRRWGYQQITANDRMQSETLPAPVTMNNGYNSSPETRLAQIRPDDAYTATRSRFPRIWPSSESDADVPATKGSTKPATLREQMKQPKHYGTDLEQGLSAENVPSGHWRAQSLPLKAPTRRSELPFHERPFPRTRRMTRTVASSTGYFSDNGASVSRPPTVTTMLPPPTGRVPRKVAASRTSHRSAAIQTRSAPTTPTKVVDEFSHMVLPPSFSPRPADGIPPYFPILSTAPDSSGRGWAKWLSRDSHGPQMASHMKAGEVRRSAKAEAAHRLGLGLPTPVTGASISASGDIRPRMGRTEANLAAAASSAAGSSAAARAYHMFAKRAYDKMGKTTSVPSRLDSNISRPNVNLEQSAQAGEYTKSRSAPAALAAAAVANDKAKQLDKTLAGLAVRYQDHSEPMSDEGMYLTPQLAYHGDPIPTDVPSDTDPNLSTPSEGMAPQAKIGKSSALAAPSAGTFRILRHFPVPEEKDVPSLRVVNAEKGNGAGDDEEYARLLFDWDGLDESPEDDDDMHDPEKPIKRSYSPWRMIMNLGGLFLTVSALLGLLAVLPIALRVITVWQEHHSPPPNITQVTVNGLENLRWTIIDSDTPRQAMHRMGGSDGKTQYNLVFSDEFNEENRSFERGMDPWWEAVDLWYWGTGDYERYDSRQVTTSGGALRIKLEERPLGGLNFRSGMLQSWNKLCMYGAGYLEVGVQLPGSANVSGLWPSVFTLGNLGRAGYGATLEGMWPYSYDSCDVGTLKNQTTTDGFPASAQTGGNTLYNRKHDTTAISFLPGQKLSACTCPQDDHPGPRLPGDDGQTYAVGRSVPEIDVFEAQVSYSGVMGVSQSVQMAPFNDLYQVSNSTGPAFTVFNNQSSPNGYNGEVTQQSISYVTPTIQGAVQHPGPNAATRAPDGAIQARPGYAVYGYELEPGPNGHLQWVAAGSPSWRMNAAAFDPDPISGIGRRVFSEEPMSIIMNLAISSAWSQPNWENLTFPAIMSIDYIRLYAPATADPNIAISCDPPNAPTTDYINRHAEAYNNPNLTIWGGMAENGGYEQTWPRNSLNPKGCKAPLSKYPGSPIDPIPKAPYVPASEIGV
ncbi:hypothetical protein A4X09_0g983 [Tilletia walkeri]|uniref:GH16 domain-containing protein n=1 Tax=Tilletia walkeri TaxID=117179 RepID=A0A8X7NE38_9BASI|nr:hypothetical protein A4X09_0g983 [Tilletia walkeri]